MQKRLGLILLYMLFIFCLGVVMVHYAKNTPLQDERPKPQAVK